MLPSKAPDPETYGHRWWPVWWATLSDRRRGQHSRANARNGFLLSPKGKGRIVWIKAGGSPESVRLACELLGALRLKRLDIRLVLTFEEDYAGIIEPRVRGLRKIGLGYGPSDRPAAVQRVLKRLTPFAIILVDTHPGTHLVREAFARGIRIVAFNTPPTAVKIEAAYPCSQADSRAWLNPDRSVYLAPAADPLALFVEAQADTTLRSLAGAGRENLPLWWWHGPVSQQCEFARAWRSSELANAGVLIVSGDQGVSPGDADLRLSAWDRTPLLAGQVVAADESCWFASVTSAMVAGHLQSASRSVIWQALAGASVLSVGEEPLGIDLGLDIPQRDTPAAVIDDWLELRATPLETRRRGDAARQRLWQERRRMQQVLDEFIQRVFDW